MDSLPLSSLGVLVEDGNCRGILSLDNSASCHYGDIGDLMVVNIPDIDHSIRFLDDMNVITCNAAVGTSVNQ